MLYPESVELLKKVLMFFLKFEECSGTSGSTLTKRVIVTDQLLLEDDKHYHMLYPESVRLRRNVLMLFLKFEECFGTSGSTLTNSV
jgi:hypothetical protein